jgi:hypothetical protein
MLGSRDIDGQTRDGALGNAKSQTLRAFRKEEMEGILAKIK